MPPAPARDPVPTARGVLRGCLRRSRRPLALAMLSAVVRQLGFLAIPYVLGQGITQGVVAADPAALVGWCGLLALAVVVEFVGLCGWIWWANAAEADLAADLRRSLLDAGLTAADGDLARASDGHGDLTARGIDDVTVVQLWVHGLATWVVIGTTVVVLVPAIAAMDPALLLVALGCAAVLAVVSVVFPRHHRPRMGRLARSQGGRSQAVSELLSAGLTVRGLGAEQTLVDRHHARSAAVTAAVLSVARLRSAWSSTAVTVPQLAVAVGLVVGVLAALDGRLDVGQLTTFALWMGTVQRATIAVTLRLGDWGAAKVSATRIAAVLAVKRPAGDPPPFVRGGAAPAFSADDLTISRGPHTIGPLSFAVARGEWAVLSGPTGSGKSSVLSALAGLVDADGTTAWSGTPLPAGAEHQSGVVTLVAQRPLLVHATLRDNLLLAVPDGAAEPTDDDLRRVCRLAALDDVVDALPRGLDTMVGERGTTLSGGQRARLAVARALLRPGPVLLLDDPTAALDLATEATLLERLRPATADRAVLWVSHRPAVHARCTQHLDLRSVHA